jgi:hypothetical protein
LVKNHVKYLNEDITSDRYKTGFDKVWRKLYTEFLYVYHIDLVKRAKYSKRSKIAEAEHLGQLENLYKLALKMFKK